MPFGDLFNPGLRALRRRQRAARPARHISADGKPGKFLTVETDQNDCILSISFQGASLPFVTSPPLGRPWYGRIAELPLLMAVEVV